MVMGEDIFVAGGRFRKTRAAGVESTRGRRKLKRCVGIEFPFFFSYVFY